MKVLSIGSSDIDLFVSPKSTDSYVQHEKTVTFHLGDKVPVNIHGMTLGGNGANVSVGMKRTGHESSFYTYVGSDLLSHQIVEAIKNEGVEIIKDETTSENASLSFIFDFKDDRIIFSHHDEQIHMIDETKLAGFEAIYLTSIGKEWTKAYTTVVNFVHTNPVSFSFSPGSPQLAELNDLIFETIACSKILFVNKEEGERILSKKNITAADMKELLRELSKLGPVIVSVTDGENGAYAYSENRYYVASSFVVDQVSVDKTGAGDAYASAFFASHLLQKDIKTAMSWGAVNASSVMSKIGAQEGLLTTAQIEEALANRPDFSVEML